MANRRQSPYKQPTLALRLDLVLEQGFPGGSEVEASACNAGDLGSIPGSNPWVRKIPWRRKWQPTTVLLPGKSHGRRSLVGCSLVHGVATSRTRLSDFTFTFHFHALENDMATHSSVLAWRIPGAGNLVGCRLWGCTESVTTEATYQQHSVLAWRIPGAGKPGGLPSMGLHRVGHN